MFKSNDLLFKERISIEIFFDPIVVEAFPNPVIDFNIHIVFS